MVFVIFGICLGASIVGALCGIGGGVIIKPLLDAVGVMDVAAVSFLSACTVLAMSAYSLLKSELTRDREVKLRIGLPLALGAAAGGVFGKWMFSMIRSMSRDEERLGEIQAICLLAVTVGALLFTVHKNIIKTYRFDHVIGCMVIGIILGILSSFLGIGGGPINLVVFYFFFSMNTKAAAENSLYVIFFSQFAGLLQTLITDEVPFFSMQILFVMVGGGIVGGIIGRYFNKRIAEKTLERLFLGVMVVIIFINIYNIIRFSK